jgi:hypothetical protein
VEIEPAAVLAVLWVFLSIVGRMVKGGGQQPRPRQPAKVPQRVQQRVQQPTSFDELLEEMRRQVEEARQRGGHPDAVGSDTWSDPYEDESELIEDRSVWEEDPTVVSMEVEPIERARETIDHDSEAELIAQRRIQEALARNRAWRLQDHREFDNEIRDLPDQSSRKERVVRRKMPIREAMIWREILSPPVAMRLNQRSEENDLP